MNRLVSYRVGLIVSAVIILALCVLVFGTLIKSTFLTTIVVSQKEKVSAINTPEEKQLPLIITPPLFQYIEITEGCGPSAVGSCVNMRSGTGEKYPVLARLRIGVVLKVAEMVIQDEHEWYKIQQDKEILYPERVKSDWFVAAGDYIHLFTDEGDQQFLSKTQASSTKQIIVDISQQMLYAYDGDQLFMRVSISTGLRLTPTPLGRFTIFKKTPSRYMQGPVPDVSDQYYDLPGVPWNLYFTYSGDVIHGTYWHNHFGQPWSHGCVNLPLQEARELYMWADVGTPVVVRN